MTKFTCAKLKKTSFQLHHIENSKTTEKTVWSPIRRYIMSQGEQYNAVNQFTLITKQRINVFVINLLVNSSIFLLLPISHWSMITHRLRNERTGFVFWTRRFLRKMADIRPLSQVKKFFTFVLLLFGEFKCCPLPYGRRYTSPPSSTAR